MNRRRFSRLLPLIGLGPASSRLDSAGNDADASTFTSVGKEERPFIDNKQAVLAEHEGQGFLTHMWFGGDFPNFTALRVRVFVDDEPEASIDMELGMGSGFGFGDPAAPWGCAYFGKTGSPSGIFNFYRIPFSRRVRVTAELPPGVANDIPFWWIVRGVTNVPLSVSGLTLNPKARLRLYKRENLVVDPLVEFDLCKTEKSGVLFLTMISAASQNFEYLEAIMRCYVGNAKSPQQLSSGLEDYFLGTYYFNRGLYHLPQAGLTHKDEEKSSFSGYRIHDADPILFRKGFRLTCRCGEQKGNKVFGPHGQPARTTYTTYVWTYEW